MDDGGGVGPAGGATLERDRPRTLATRAERARRVLLLGEPHMAPLAALVREFRKERGVTREIPQFDPLDGGIDARILFVLEGPGKKAVESGFISRNNDDESAVNLFVACELVELPRESTIVWNLVPWHLIKDRGTVRSPTELEIAKAKPYLERVIALLPHLEAIMLFGLNAQRQRAWIAGLKTGVTILDAPLPSPRFLEANPDNRARLEVAFRALAEVLSREKAAGPA